MNKKEVISNAFSMSTRGKILSGIEWGLIMGIGMRLTLFFLFEPQHHVYVPLNGAAVFSLIAGVLLGSSQGWSLLSPKLFPPDQNDIDRFLAKRKIELENQIKVTQNREQFYKKELVELTTMQFVS